MPKKKGWTITAGNGWGTLTHEDGRNINFGTANNYKGQTNRIDMRRMSHGMFDTADKCIPCFIAAADILDEELGATSSATVHCQNGNSRTSFALIVFLVRYEGFSVAEAGDFVSQGQDERTDINFSLTKQANNNSYWSWIQEEKWSNAIESKQNKLGYRATFVTSKPEDKGNKILHVVATNIAQPIQFIQPTPSPVITPTAPAMTSSPEGTQVQHYTNWRPIRQSEVRDLKQEAKNFLGDDWKY